MGAETLAAAGDFGRAEALARSIPDTRKIGSPDGMSARDHRARALALIAGNGTSERSRQLLALALTQTTRYVPLLPMLARAEPSAVIEVAKNNLRILHSRGGETRSPKVSASLAVSHRGDAPGGIAGEPGWQRGDQPQVR